MTGRLKLGLLYELITPISDPGYILVSLIVLSTDANDALGKPSSLGCSAFRKQVSSTLKDDIQLR